MKAKQVLAKLFASAMVFSTLFGTSVMADEIEGDTIYIDQEVIDVTLPTTQSQKFYIDPQGLIAVGKDSNSGAPDNAGTVVGASEMYAINRSSIPLALTVSYKLVDSATSDKVTVETTVSDSGAAVKAATSRTIAVSVTADEATTDAESGTYRGHVFKENTTSGVDLSGSTGVSADVVYVGSAATETAYIMTAETYKAQLKSGKTAADAFDSSSYEYVVDTTAHKASCVKLTIGGYCSQKADWSSYAKGTETLKLDVTFKFKKVASALGDNTDVKVGSDEVSVGPKVTMTADGKITISGLTAEKNIQAASDIVIIGSNYQYSINETNAIPDVSDWDAANGGTLKYELTSEWHGLNGDSVKIEVSLKDGSKVTSDSVTFSF